jgi:pentatricopeptide repeat protein
MPHKDEDTWTYMIGLCVRSDRPQHALDLFSAAVQQGLKINGVACVNALKACTTSSRLMHLHVYIIGHGLGYNLYVRNTLLDMYCKRGSIDDALHLFMELQVLSVVSWNTIIAGLIRHEHPKKALELFDDMKNKGFRPDGVTFLCVIKACTDEMQGVLHRIHAEVISNALESDCFIASALIDMYATLGNLKYACTILRRAGSQDAPLWNSIILGHAEHGDAAEAMGLFREMEEEMRMAPDKVTYLSLLKACARLQDVASGGSVHGRITECGMEDRSFVESAIIDMYAKCGAIEEARHVFDRTIEPDLVSWNAIIAAYCVSGSPLEALGLFREMVAEKDVAPDKVTYLTALKACASLGAFQHGKHIHACIYEDGFDLDAFTGSMLIDMYGKCGMAWHARDVFDTMLARDAVSWSAMIAGYGQLGRVNEAVELLLEMDRECIPIDDVTFVGILSACTHSGLVEEGCACFDAMKKQHGIAPTSEICACMVDLLGRAGQMMEALAFIKVANVEPTASVWMALLNACKLSADLGLARYASQRVRDLDPRCTSAFVLLSNICVTA